jgi:hypothetical protein
MCGDVCAVVYVVSAYIEVGIIKRMCMYTSCTHALQSHARVWLSPRRSRLLDVIAVPRKIELHARSRQEPACACQPAAFPIASHAVASRLTKPSSKDYLPHPSGRVPHSSNTSQPYLQTKVSADTLEFLQRPNGSDDAPVAAPIQPLGGGDPAPKSEPVEAPKHEEHSAPKETPSKPAQEPKSNGAPVESKPAEPQSADMSYADMAAKGPKQTDEEKYGVTYTRVIATKH